jgi:FkbM family methyltransferase
MLKRSVVDVLERLPEQLRRNLKARHYAHLLSHDLVGRDPDLYGLRLLVKNDDNVVDIGANVGIWTHYLAQLVGPEGRVWSFEPVPETFALLSLNVQRFDLKRVVVINQAVSDSETMMPMSVPRDSRGIRNYHLARIGLVPNSSAFQISAVRLDSWFLRAGKPQITFVKIDTEEHELACIRGMSLLLDSCRPSLCVEISSDLDDSASDGSQLESLLKVRGYETYIWIRDSFQVRPRGERRTNYFFMQPEHFRLRDGA